MAWRCHGSTNLELLQKMRDARLIQNDRVFEAMKNVDRKNYVVDERYAYEDRPQSIGYGATISAPHMHAHACENLLPLLRPGARVLDVGAGSGYLLGILHNLVQPGGRVVGIEHIDELAQMSRDNLKRDGKLYDDVEMQVVTGDGRLGFADGGPYEAIHVGAAAPEMPKALIDQLASPGRMFIPVGRDSQEIIQVDKDANGNVTQTKLFGVSYVPLTDKAKQTSHALR